MVSPLSVASFGTGVAVIAESPVGIGFWVGAGVGVGVTALVGAGVGVAPIAFKYLALSANAQNAGFT